MSGETWTLWHFTCADGRAGILRSGAVQPLRPSHPGPSQYAWFTDLDGPDRLALGLTSHILDCDRTEHRFRATDTSGLRPWVEVRRMHPWARLIETAPGAMPRHWYVSTEPVPVTASDWLPVTEDQP